MSSFVKWFHFVGRNVTHKAFEMHLHLFVFCILPLFASACTLIKAKVSWEWGCCTRSPWPNVSLTVVSVETFLCGPPKISVCLVVTREIGLAIFQTVSWELLVSASKLDLKRTNQSSGVVELSAESRGKPSCREGFMTWFQNTGPWNWR